jgi:hypothetical protein
MRGNRHKAHKNDLPKDLKFEDFVDTCFDIFARSNHTAIDLRNVALRHNTTLEGVLLEVFANFYHSRNEPLPPDLLQKIEQHPDIPMVMRRRILKSDLD